MGRVPDIYVSVIGSILSVNHKYLKVVCWPIAVPSNTMYIHLFICILNIVGLYILKFSVDCPIALT